MSFFQRIKKGLGFGTLEAKLNVWQIARDCDQIEGDFTLTAKSDQQINEVMVKFEMVQHWEETKHRQDSNGREQSYLSQESRTFELGNYSDKTPFEMKASEVKVIHFVIPYQIGDTQSPADAAIEKGGVSAVLGTIWKLTSNMRNVHFDYKVEGKVDLQGVAIDPKDSKTISMA